MWLDKDKIKNSLTKEDIHKIMMDLGSEFPRRDKEGNPIFTTICHNNHGGSHKLYYYDESKQFHCYSECQENMDIFQIVERVKKCSFPSAVKYVADLSGKHYSSTTVVSNNKIDDWEWINKFNKKSQPNVQLNTYNECVLDMFLPLSHEEWLDEGITDETMRKFEIGFHVTQNKITIPQRSKENKLIGVRGRALNDEDIAAGKKYMPLTIEGLTYSTMSFYSLYGLNHTQKAIKRIKKVMIFEDEKSVLKCEDYFGEDNFAVATFGSNLSDYQVRMLLELGIEEVFIARDKEYQEANSEEAYRYSTRLLKQAMKFVPYVRTYILFDEWDLLHYKDSPADQGRDVLIELMKKKFEICTSESEEYEV
ncbi:hypothetical protein WKH57_01600 [Niallia taxi]|uniref:hypothetical protein n=1 Tax=Niallia taxi TaxID=2499688 RepID=UPI00317BBE4C